MLTWVLYDIGNDRLRGRAAKACQRIGLYRVQKSVFLGELAVNEQDELAVELADLMEPDVDRVYIFPMCRDDFGKIHLLGQAFDQSMVCDELKSLFV
ncbi:MAG: CRISPR-associated endonuclease Cas2 [Thermoguttaceae bacterium]